MEVMKFKKKQLGKKEIDEKDKYDELGLDKMFAKHSLEKSVLEPALIKDIIHNAIIFGDQSEDVAIVQKKITNN